MLCQVQFPIRDGMTVFNLGSINIDLVYAVPYFPAPGETLTTLDYRRMLGGKGTNQSIALARAGSAVVHIGAVHGEDGWIRDEMRAAGVDISAVQTSGTATGHAVVSVSSDGENQILLWPGANHAINMQQAIGTLDSAREGDWALLQNETCGADEFVGATRARGLNIAYSAAPFDAAVTARLLPHTDLLVVNEVEAAALADMLGTPAQAVGLPHLVITKGSAGADYHGADGTLHQPAFMVTPVDTTGAGDCFLGYLLAGVAQGWDMASSLRLASAAAALQVTHHGAAAAIPTRRDVDEFLAAQA